MFDAVTYSLLMKQISAIDITGNVELSKAEDNAIKAKSDGLYVKETEYEDEDIDFSQF